MENTLTVSLKVEVWCADDGGGAHAYGRTAHHAAHALLRARRAASHIDAYGARWHSLPVALTGGTKRVTYELARHTSGIVTTTATATRVG